MVYTHLSIVLLWVIYTLIYPVTNRALYNFTPMGNPNKSCHKYADMQKLADQRHKLSVLELKLSWIDLELVIKYSCHVLTDRFIFFEIPFLF